MKKTFGKAASAAFVTVSMLLAGAGNTAAKDLQKVKLLDSNPVVIIHSPELYVPLAMGWWRKEGYDVEIVPSQGSSAGVQLLVGGSVDVGMQSTIPMVVANSKGLANLRSVLVYVNTVWRLATLKQGGVTNPADLKGKTVGLATPGPGGAMYLNGLLKKAGVDPSEVKQVVSGIGMQSLEALRNGTIDAFLTFRPDIVQLEVLGGIEFNQLYDEAWLRFPDYGFVATQEIIDKDPKMVEGIARGILKAMVFLNENPNCVARIYSKNHAPGSNRSVETDTLILKDQLPDRDIPFRQAGAKLRGQMDAAGLEELEDFLLENKFISTKLPGKDQIINVPGFFERVNDFSVEDVRKQARDCAGY
jgi:NitT/TauT family transport system substrate-binding protein